MSPGKLLALTTALALIAWLIALPARAEMKIKFYWPHVYEKQEVSAYTASPDETDGEPNIMADGSQVSQVRSAIACPPSIPFGSHVLYNGKWFTCHDRMNKRYRNGVKHWDILVGSKAEAYKHGRKKNQIITVYLAE